MDEVNIPGTLANTKVKFHHRKAGKEVKVSSLIVIRFRLKCYVLSCRIIMPV